MPDYEFRFAGTYAGAPVAVTKSGGSVVARGKAGGKDTDGMVSFRVDLPPGTYTGTATHPNVTATATATGVLQTGDKEGLEQAALNAAYVSQEQRPDPFPQQRLSYSKGGVVGTSGKVPVAIRFDDWQDQIISLNLITELNNRGLFGSIALCTTLASNPWNQTITWDTLRTWNRTYGMEMWSHGTDHNSPYSTTPATFTANLRTQIVESKQAIEAQGMRCMGWAMPGVPVAADGSPGYKSYLMTSADWQTEAGKLLTATYGLVETDMTDRYRHLPGGLRYGLGHWTVSDGKTLQQSKDVLDGAINLGFGVEFMCHAGNLGLAGNITTTQFLEFLDYIVTKRDAGLIEVVTPSTLPFCDPGSTRRLDLLGNADFEAAVPTSSTTVIGNWRNVDGTNRYITTVADGPLGGSTKVLHCQGSTLVNQTTERTKGRGLSGQTLILDAWVRCIQVSTVTTSSVRFLALDTDNASRMNFDTTIPVTTAWKRLRMPFTMPPDTDNVSFGFGRGSTVGSGQIEWESVHIYVA